MPVTKITQFDISESSRRDQDETSDTNVKKLFRPVLLLMKIAGIFIERKDKGGTVSCVVVWLYCIFLMLVHIADCIRFLFIYKDEEFRQLSSRLAGMFSMTTFSILGTLFNVGFLYLNSKHVPKIMCALSSYEEKYGVRLTPKLLKKQRITIVIMTLINILLDSVLLGLLLTFLSEKSIIMKLLVGFPYSNYLEKLIPIIFISIRMAFIALGMAAVSAFGHTFINLIGQKYLEVAKNVADLAEGNTENIETFLELYRKQHECLTALIRTANPILQYDIIITYATGIPAACFLLYAIAGGGLEMVDVIILMEFFFGALGGLLYYTLMGAGLRSKAHEVNDVLFQFDLTQLSEKATRQLQIFISRVNQPIGINVYDMFTVDRSSLLMLFGTILTYSIVVFQTTGPTTCSNTTYSDATTVSTSCTTS